MGNVARLIINADDFGYSKFFNQGILEMMDAGIVTSTTALVNHISISEQAEQLRKLAELRNWKGVSVGLHFEADNSKSIGPQMVEQHAKFRQIFGFEPSHFDIHKQITNTEIINALNSYAEQLHMPVRNHGIRAKTRQPDDQVFFSTFKRIDEIRDYLDKLEYDKTYEMLTHPGRYDPKSESSLNQEREEDMRNLAWIDEYLKTRKDIQKISYFNI